jgi:phospholipid/cholesterol/gamma-HCH transport system substrate-binding protein
MKISNETKVGALAAVTITLLVLGFNFLKGKTFFSNSRTFYAKYSNVQGLLPSNPVVINGMSVGSVYTISSDKNMKEILVTLNLTKDVNIPTNSIAVIKPNPLGTTSMEIKLGDATTYIPKNDTILTEKSAGLFDEALRKVDPILYEVKNAVKALDSVLLTVNSIVDPNSKNNIRAVLDNLAKTTAHLTVSSASLEILLNTQTGALAKTLDNLSSFTGTLAKNNDKFTSVMSNLDKTTANFAKLDLNRTLDTLNATVNGLKASLSKLNTTEGTAGMLLNDKRLYNNLAATANKINVLIDDIKTNPKRYISFSVFGKKAKGPVLMVPLPDTLNAPYIEVK